MLFCVEGEFIQDSMYACRNLCKNTTREPCVLLPPGFELKKVTLIQKKLAYGSNEIASAEQTISLAR